MEKLNIINYRPLNGKLWHVYKRKLLIASEEEEPKKIQLCKQLVDMLEIAR